MDVAAGLRTPATWTLTLQQWAPQVDSSTPFDMLSLACVCVCLWNFWSHCPFFTFSWWCKWKKHWMRTPCVPRAEPSFREPHNTFQWPRTILTDWFSSVTSSAYWVISPWMLLFSYVPGASQSSLDLLWHLMWASGWSGESIAWNVEEVS